MSEAQNRSLVENPNQYGGERLPGITLPNFAGVGSFGPVVFGVSEEQMRLVRNVSRKTSARFEEHQVVGSKPCLEFIAPNLDEVSLSITLHAGFGINPRFEIKRLRDICAAGQVQYLVLGGENFGQFVLEDAEETWHYNGPEGVLLVATVALTLKEYF